MIRKIYGSMMVGMLLLGSCSPRVITQIEKTYPAISTDSVAVYETFDSVKADAEVLGTIQVKDKGLTTNCGLERMLGIARQKTAEAGGNILKLTEHRYPDMRSTCHRLWGTMLRTNDLAAVDSQLYLTQQQADYYMRQAKSKPQTDNSGDVVRVSAGPSWIVSKFEIDDRTYRGKLGSEVGASYEHYWKNGLGVGVDFSYYHTAFDTEYDGDYDVNLLYIGPSFAYRLSSKKWQLYEAVGLGYSRYNEEYYSVNGLGVMARLGINYLVSKHLGIGASLNAISTRLKEPHDAGSYLDDDEYYGIGRISVMVGLSYCF